MFHRAQILLSDLTAQANPEVAVDWIDRLDECYLNSWVAWV